ncbi:hypothetical protein GJAV_G00050310 [Gymnothorax javanicus]|nr:hypothetical protein GJAV_G00050310 [Gymnothorax javanicus]
MMFRPLVSDPIFIHRKSPLPRSKKIGSVEEDSPLSVSSPDSIGTWIHYTCGVGTGRRRRRSGEPIPSSPVSPKSLAFTSSIFGSWQQVLSENNSHTRAGRLLSEHKLTTGMETTRGSAVKRFSISFARHPTNGFELYSMVPSICPLETLHNSLSLKQVDEFLASIAMSHESIFQTPTSSPASSLGSGSVPMKKTPLNTYTPAKVLPCPFTSGKKTLERAVTVSGGSPSRTPRGGLAAASPSVGAEQQRQSSPKRSLGERAVLEPTREEAEPPPGSPPRSQHTPNSHLPEGPEFPSAAQTLPPTEPPPSSSHNSPGAMPPARDHQRYRVQTACTSQHDCRHHPPTPSPPGAHGDGVLL